MIHLRICCFQFFQSSKAAKRDGCSFGADGTCCACAAEWPTDSSRLLSGCISTWPGGGAPGARGGSSVALHLFRLSLSLLPFFLLCSTIQCALSSCWTVRKKSKIGSNFFFPKNSNWKIRIPPRFIQQCAKLPDDNKFSDEILGWKNVNNFCHFFRGADRWDRWAKIHEIRYEEEEEGGGTKMSA